MSVCFMHHNQIISIEIIKGNYDTKNIFVVRKAVGFWPMKYDLSVQGKTGTVVWL